MEKKEFVDLNKMVEMLRRDERLSHYFVSDGLVQMVFRENPTNKDLDGVMSKVMILDCFYSTNVHYIKNGYRTMARHIVGLSENNSLDDLIAKGDISAVELIRDREGLNCYSFATKYCCLSNGNDGYYIYDSLVSDLMYRFAREKGLSVDGRAITTEDKQLSEYKNYFAVCEEYKKANNLVGTRRNMDWFLWGTQKIKQMEAA